MSGSDDHTASVPTPVVTRGPGNQPLSMRMKNIDKMELCCGVDDGERSTGTDRPVLEQETTRGGRKMKETRRNAGIAAGSAGLK